MHTHKYITNTQFLISLIFLDCRFKSKDIPGSVSKGIPDFCTIYVISKGKISTTRAASRPAPFVSPIRSQIVLQPSTRSESEISIPYSNSSKGNHFMTIKSYHFNILFLSHIKFTKCLSLSLSSSKATIGANF